MANNKFLDADGVKIFWDKAKNTFLPKDTAANSAVKLQNSRKLKITDGENFGTEVNFDGTNDATLNLPNTIKAEIDGNAKTATTLKIPVTIQTDLESSDALNFDGSAVKNFVGVTGILPENHGGTGKNNLDDVTVGTATKAKRLETSCKIQTDLSRTTAENFNGTTNIEPGIKGILGVENGGTGNDKGNANSATKLLNEIKLTIQDHLGVNTGRPVYFNGENDTTLKLPETIQGNITGNATSATKAEKDFEDNIISETYAKIESPELTGSPQAPTADPNDDSRKIATTAFVAEAIRRLVGTAPETLDTLTELATAINKDGNFATTIANELSQKQNKSDALTSIANLLTSSDKMIYTTANNVYSVTDLTAFARSLLGNADATTARNTLDALGKNENALSANTAAECSGNSATASQLQNAKKFKITDGENFGAEFNFDGTNDATLNLPNKIKAEIDGNAKTATNLKTPRTIQANLESSNAVNFDGSENISVGVTGILSTENGGTGKNNLADVTVGNAIQAEKDTAGNIIAETFLHKFKFSSLKIPVEGWQINSDHENFNYCYPLEIENTTPNDVININLSPESHGIAVTCGLCATVEISNGLIWIFSKTVPTAEISADYYILKGQETEKEIGYGSINTSTSQREIIYNVPEQSGKLTYTGGELRPIWLNYDPTKLLISGEITGVDAKTYAVYFTPIGNCTWSDDTRTARRQIWKIERAVIQVPEQSGNLIFNGLLQSPTLLNYDENKMTLSGDFENQKDAGTYTAYATPKENFVFEDKTTSAKDFSWQIQKAPLDFSINKNSLNLSNANITDIVFVDRAGDGVISATSNDTSIATVEVDGAKVKVTAVATGSTKIFIEIAEGTNYFGGSAEVDVENYVIKPLNQCTPAEILDAVKSEKAPTAWNVGDKATPIILNGEIGAALTLNNFEICARVIGFNHNSILESNGKVSVHFALDATVDGKNIAICDSNFDSASASGTNYFQHNLRNGTNAGGWTESNIRKNILADIFNALPQEWQEIISTCTKYTGIEDQVTATQDKLFLLSEFEVFGRQDYANETEQNFQMQYDYFKNGNDTIHCKHDDTETPCYWWLRTPQFSKDTSFCRVDITGTENTYNALYSQGIIPCFVIS